MSKINSIITGTYLQHHAKYKDQSTIFNDTMPVFIGNYDFVMPATEDERRQTVLDVSGQFIGNINFFRDMRYELECGGYRRLMYDLLEFGVTVWICEDHMKQRRSQIKNYKP